VIRAVSNNRYFTSYPILVGVLLSVSADASLMRGFSSSVVVATEGRSRPLESSKREQDILGCSLRDSS